FFAKADAEREAEKAKEKTVFGVESGLVGKPNEFGDQNEDRNNARAARLNVVRPRGELLHDQQKRDTGRGGEQSNPDDAQRSLRLIRGEQHEKDEEQDGSNAGEKPMVAAIARQKGPLDAVIGKDS